MPVHDTGKRLKRGGRRNPGCEKPAVTWSLQGSVIVGGAAAQTAAAPLSSGTGVAHTWPHRAAAM